MSLLDSVKFKSLVSSVLNKDIKQHGKNFMFDSEEDTSWSSSEGTPQWIALQFDEPQTVTSFSFQFQGGFVGKDAQVTATKEDGTEIGEPFYPDDINSVQTFNLKQPIENTKKLKFVFGSSSDFFGRIIVYKLKVL
ncbi:nuclear receptor 2C2-associated protein [Episyrphus balteatus]|uniref:nuclear receptor 2C2-associated protein n=1 Tax=Episyrphus balteatus TaxID=286459 RepID=UPI0024866418|nr:nuclear receptor 2C2-associated protein [Episyrphus balteatus]